LSVVLLFGQQAFADHLFVYPHLNEHWFLSAARFSLIGEVSGRFRGCHFAFQQSLCDPGKPVSPEFCAFQVWYLRFYYSVLFP